MEGGDTVQPYWSGGLLRAGLAQQPGSFSPEALAKAAAALEEFLTEWRKTYFAFNGRPLMVRLIRRSKAPRQLT
jgi:hypothetical protein